MNVRVIWVRILQDEAMREEGTLGVWMYALPWDLMRYKLQLGICIVRTVWGPDDLYAILGRLLQVTICMKGIFGG